MMLVSDHVQFYDSIFDSEAPCFQRVAFSRGGLNKREQFRLFRELGLCMPLHGSVAELRERWSASGPLGSPPRETLREVFCVVYLDEYAHRGAGKQLMSMAEASERYPQAFASVYVPQVSGPVIFRFVRFGRICFWICQRGQAGGWKSNRNDRESVLSRFVATRANPIPRVLWAIDYVPAAEGLLALDFNTAPDLTVLEEENRMSRAEARAELEHAACESPSWLRQF